MSGEDLGSLVVSLGIDSSLFEKGVKDINKSMTLLKSEFSATSSKLKEFGSDAEKLQSKAEFLGKAMQLQESKVKSLAQAYEKSKSELGENAKATQELAIKLNQAISQYNKFEGELKQTNKALENSTQEVEKQGNVWDKLKNQIKNATSGMWQSIKNGIGMAIGGDIWSKAKEGFLSISTFGNDFAKSLNGVQAATGYTGNALASLKGVMTDVYNDNFGESFEEVAEAVKTIGQQSGESGDKLKQLSEGALSLKDTFGFEVNESFRSAKMLMDQFGISGEQAYNLIATGAQYGLDKNGDLLDTINEYSVHFKQLGMNSDEMFNSLMNGAANGTFSVDKLGDAVKEFGIRAKDGSDSTVGAFQSLGLDVDKISQDFAKGGESGKQAFEKVTKTLLGMKDPLQQNQIGTALFGTIWEDLGVKGITALVDMKGEITSTNGALQDINKVKYNDLGSAFEGIKRNLQTGLLIPLSDMLLPKLNEFGQYFKDNMPQIKQTVKDMIAGMIPIFEGLGKVIQFIIDNSNWLIPVLAGVAVGFAAFSIISPIVTAFTALSGAIAGVSGAMAIMNAVFMLSPIGWIAAAIGVLVVAGIALYKNWDTIKAKADAIWTVIKTSVVNFKNSVVQKFGEIKTGIIEKWNGLKEGIVAVFTSIGNGISTAFNFIKNVVTVGIMLIGSVIKAAFTIITLPFMFIWENLKVYIIAFWNFISTKIGSAIKVVASVISTGFNAVVGFLSTVWNGVKTVVVGVWDFISSKIMSVIIHISGIITSVFNAIVGFLLPIWESVKNAVVEAWDYIGDKVKSAINFVWGIITSVFNAVSGFISRIWNGIKNTISEAWNYIANIFSSVGGGIANTVGGIFEKVKNAIGDKIESAKKIVSSGLNKIKEFFSGLALKLPDIKLPHFKLKGNFSLNPPQVPELAVNWYASGGIFNSPSVIGVGEAGTEAVTPLDKLQTFIDNAVRKAMGSNAQGGTQTIQLVVDGRVLAEVVAENQKFIDRYNNRMLGGVSSW